MARTKQSPYSVHPSVVMMQKWVAELPEKTGKSLDEWVQLVSEEGPPTEKERRQWLKKKFKLGTNASWWIAERSVGKGKEDSDPEAYLRAAEGYVNVMFSGAKAKLRPLYEKLLELGLSIGKDVKACPCKTIIPLYRRHVFAQIKPATSTRIDFGFALGNMKAEGRLIDTGGFAKKDRITHRIAITKIDEIDDVRKWLKTAYNLDNKE
ncbi:DUF4287 domain-containing protein [Candidatus Acetothermia bacterium]|nr:DUF4287 domain-containing protein [Candidatus Acetothermia bacterium]